MRDLSSVKRIVIKVGTNLLSSPTGLNRERIKEIVREIATLREMGYQTLLVSSGAIGLGAKALNHTHSVKYIPLRQACAAIGQPELMSAYREEAAKYNLISAQILITRSVLNSRESYKNLRDAVNELLSLGVLPIFNENDVISTKEIGEDFGDNDHLSAYVASKIDADLLILLTDIDALYTANPKEDKNAIRIQDIEEITKEVLSYASGKGSEFSTGGMKTKLLASLIAQKGGCGTIIASGEEENVIIRIIKGEEIGTYIHPDKRLKQKERWIINSSPKGEIVVDLGAKDALLIHKKSLLPKGIVEVKGIFKEGDVVSISIDGEKPFMKAITGLDSSSIALIKGKTQKEGEAIIGKKRAIIFRPEDSVVTNDEI